MTGDDAVLWLDATDQAALVRSGELTPSELVDRSIARIEELNHAVGAVIYERFEAARHEAAAVDSALPLAGVPVLVKETTPMAGEPNDLGSYVLAERGRTAHTNDPMVASMQKAGMIVLGQSIAPEFALMSTSENRAHGRARNPWNLSRTSGGSSGGASAAVAAGFIPVGQGGDGGGSLRMPASFCHLVALKPSLGLIAPKPGGDRWGHSVPGYVTRSVRDVAMMMDLLRTDFPGPVGSRMARSALVDATGRDPKSLRIGVLTNRVTAGEPVDPEVDAAVRTATSVFSELGHEVVEEYPSRFTDPANVSAFFDALSVTATMSIDALTAEVGHRLAGDELDPVTRLWDDRGRAITGLELAAAFVELDQLRAEMSRWWASGFDVLLAPVFPTPPLESGWPWSEPDGVQKTVDVVRLAAPINSTGQPAVSLPVTMSSAGTPIGVQIIGALGRDELLVSLAAQYERARPWSDQHPQFEVVVESGR